MVQQRQLLKKSGGFRYIIQYASLDCIILRLLAQKLNRYLDSMFKDKSFAYRQGKGVMAAVMQAVEYLNEILLKSRSRQERISEICESLYLQSF